MASNLKSPSLKYGLYNLHLFEAFNIRRERLNISSKLETFGKESK